MAYTLNCRNCEWRIEEPVELKGEANWLAGQHISETGHSVRLERVESDDEDDFRRGGGSIDVLSEPVSGSR